MAIHFFSLKTTSCGRVTKSNVSKSLGQHKAWEYVHNIHMILMFSMFSSVFPCFPMLISHVLPSGYVKIAIENGHLVRGFTH